MSLAIITITSALLFYSIGVWAEKVQRTLKPWHVAMFFLGLVCDGSGTWMMSQVAAANPDATRGPLMSIMAITGALALILMAAHAVWALVVLVRNREKEKRTFHVFSLVVWAIWLVPYFTGAAGAMIG